MSVARGRVVYSTGDPPCIGLGLNWSGEHLDAALRGPVAANLFDDEGTAEIEAVLHGVVETEFERDRLQRSYPNLGVIEDWRVGEALAEAWLTVHRTCIFPWPDGRDERKKGSSLPGADLVGLHADSNGDCLAFGEVKTSSVAEYPPGVMYGRKGLQRQLEDIRDNTLTRDGLFRYLGHRARGSAWIERFRRAAKRYLIGDFDVHLFGFLVRDIPPHENDLRARVNFLGRGCPDPMKIELYALYLPANCIKGLGEAVLAARKGDPS